MSPIILISLVLLLFGTYNCKRLTKRQSNKSEMDLADRNASHVTIDFMTVHQEILEGDNLNLRCVVTIQDESEVLFNWLFISGANQFNEQDEPVELLVEHGILDVNKYKQRYEYKVRRSWDAVTDFNTEEHYLEIHNIIPKEQGIYACQILSPETGDLLASKHSIVSVTPRHSLNYNHLADEIIPTFETLPFTSSSNLDDINNNNNNKDSDHPPTLGPITERFVVATRGTNVILECRDSDDNWVYWKKHGDPTIKGEGRELRLFRVDKWDSGLYYCTTNTSFADYNSRHNVTLKVIDHKPTVKVSPKYDQDGNAKEAKQAIGHSVILTCKVEAVPVPQISWYKVEETNEEASPTSIAEIGIRKPSEKRFQLHSGNDIGISISDFKDGLIISQIRLDKFGIRKEVSENDSEIRNRNDFGIYECEARNALGKAHDSIRISPSKTVIDYEKESPNSNNNNINKSSSSNKSHQRLSLAFMFVSVSISFFSCFLLD